MPPNRLLPAVLFATLGLVAACGREDEPIEAGDAGSAETGDGETSDEGVPVIIDTEVLTASTWVLRFGGGPDGEVTIVDGWPITITFRDDGTVGGTAACNGYGGLYTIDGSQFILSEVGSTDMGCEPAIQASERAYLSALIDVDGINLGSDGLALSGPATELIFAPTEPAPVDVLVGQLWLLEALTPNGQETPVEGQPATLLIEADGSFTGSTGCRLLFGRYVVSGNEVAFNEMTTDGECPTSLADQDGRVTNVLGDGFVPTIEGDTLTLVSSGNEGLRYRAITEGELSAEAGTQVPSDADLLDGVVWTFTGGDSPDGPIPDPRTVDPEAEITLTFSNGAYEGTVICNDYGGDANIDGTLWSFGLGVPGADEEGCGDGLDEIVAAYLDALPQMSEGGIESDGAGLVMNGNEIELQFERTG